MVVPRGRVADQEPIALEPLRSLLAGRRRDNHTRLGCSGAAQLGREALHAGVAAPKPWSSTRACQIASALRPRDRLRGQFPEGLIAARVGCRAGTGGQGEG
jgi:hypothetical protein